MRTDFCQCIWLYQYLADQLVNKTGKYHQKHNELRFICGENIDDFSKEFKHLKKIYHQENLRPASNSIEITANVDLSYDQNDFRSLDLIDLSSAESSESSDIWDDFDELNLAENFTRLAAEMNQTKEIEQVDPEVSTL